MEPIMRSHAHQIHVPKEFLERLYPGTQVCDEPNAQLVFKPDGGCTLLFDVKNEKGTATFCASLNGTKMLDVIEQLLERPGLAATRDLEVLQAYSKGRSA